MPRCLFVSHVFEDGSSRAQLEAWAAQGLLGPDVAIVGERRDARADGDTAIRRELSPMLRGAAAVLVLIGKDTHNHAWVAYEVDHALSSRKPVVPIRIPGTSGAAPRSIAERPLVQFRPDAIRSHLGL